MRTWAIATIVMMMVQIIKLIFHPNGVQMFDWDEDTIRNFQLLFKFGWVIWGIIVIF